MNSVAEDYFSGWFEPSFLKELTRVAIYSRVPKGEELKSTTSFVKYIPLIINGSVKVLKSKPKELKNKTSSEILKNKGSKKIKTDTHLYTMQKGEICTVSLAAAMEHGDISIKMIAEKDTELFLIPYQHLISWMKHYSSWNAFIIRLFANRYNTLVNELEERNKEKLDLRLKKFLLLRSEKEKSKNILMSREELAREMGTSKPLLSKVLKKLEELGFLKRQKSGIMLTFID